MNCVTIKTATNQANAEGNLAANVTYTDGYYKNLTLAMRPSDFMENICSKRQIAGVSVQNPTNDVWVGTIAAFDGLFRCTSGCTCPGNKCAPLDGISWGSNLLRVGSAVVNRDWVGTICDDDNKCFLKFDEKLHLSSKSVDRYF